MENVSGVVVGVLLCMTTVELMSTAITSHLTIWRPLGEGMGLLNGVPSAYKTKRSVMEIMIMG